MNTLSRLWHKLRPGMKMRAAMVLLGPPDDSVHTAADLTVWTFRSGGWIRFKEDRVMDWAKPLS